VCQNIKKPFFSEFDELPEVADIGIITQVLEIGIIKHIMTINPVERSKRIVPGKAIEEVLDLSREDMRFPKFDTCAYSQGAFMRIPTSVELLPPCIGLEECIAGIVREQIEVLGETDLWDSAFECSSTHLDHGDFTVAGKIGMDMIILMDSAVIHSLKVP
jgi:hypothetical protein